MRLFIAVRFTPEIKELLKAAACASCTSSPSPPTTRSTFTTPKGSTSRGWCFTSNNHAYHPIFHRLNSHEPPDLSGGFDC